MERSMDRNLRVFVCLLSLAGTLAVLYGDSYPVIPCVAVCLTCAYALCGFRGYPVMADILGSVMALLIVPGVRMRAEKTFSGLISTISFSFYFLCLLRLVDFEIVEIRFIEYLLVNVVLDGWNTCEDIAHFSAISLLSFYILALKFWLMKNARERNGA